MERRTFLKLTGATALAGALAKPAIAAPTTVRWWYHFDNAQASPAELVAKFEAANPDIKIEAESIPWGGGNDYYTRLFAALVAGNAPDCAQNCLIQSPGHIVPHCALRTRERVCCFRPTIRGRSPAIHDQRWTGRVCVMIGEQ